MDWDAFFLSIKTEVFKILSDLKGQEDFKIAKKEDKTYVTLLDKTISDLFSEKLKNYPELSSLPICDEEKETQLNLPSIIIDPIDGTKEVVSRIAQAVVSFSVVYGDPKKKDVGWVYNPFTGFELSSFQLFTPLFKETLPLLTGLVSSSEWNKGLYEGLPKEKLRVAPRGSIANKLALMASGACDFVISLRPKNIWDIAGGTVLLKQRGYEFYSQGKKVSLAKKYYEPPLLWCQERHKNLIEEEMGKI